MLQAGFLFFIVFRMLTSMARLFQDVSLNLALFGKIFNFLLSFIMPLAFCILAWAFCSHIIFGKHIEAYSTLLLSLVSTIMISLKDFNFLDEMYEINPNTTIVLFVIFVVITMFFLADIFVSLVILVFNEIMTVYLKREHKSSEEILR